MRLTQLHELVDATTISIEPENFEDALTAYRHAKARSQGASLESIMSDMKRRLARQLRKKKEEKSPK